MVKLPRWLYQQGVFGVLLATVVIRVILSEQGLPDVIWLVNRDFIYHHAILFVVKVHFQMQLLRLPFFRGCMVVSFASFKRHKMINRSSSIEAPLWTALLRSFSPSTNHRHILLLQKHALRVLLRDLSFLWIGLLLLMLLRD